MSYPGQTILPSSHVLKTFQTLIERVPESDRKKAHVVFIAGEQTGFRNDTDRELSFRQESNFYYLSGCKVPSSYILATFQLGTPFAAKPHVQLFIPEAQSADIMWSVPPPPAEVASKEHDVTEVKYSKEVPSSLLKIIDSFHDPVFHIMPHDSSLFPHLPDVFADFIRKPGSSGCTFSEKYLLPALQRARLIKDQAEIDEMQRANDISSRAHEVVMRVLGLAVKGKIEAASGAGVERPFLPGEWLIEKEAEAEAIFVASCRREGANHQAYLPIVAASTRASTLHYCCNDREFAWGPVKPHDHHNNDQFAHGKSKEITPQVLLIDAGCEWNFYSSDITRTMPVGNGGKFTPEAKAIYELVLEMQRVSFQALKPGLHWDVVQLLCHQTLVKGFQRLGIFKSPSLPQSGSWNAEEAILASGISSAFFPHGVGHSLGMDVHDVPDASKPVNNNTINKDLLGHDSFYTYLRLRLPLEAGMVVTVEPGIYFSPHLLAPVRDSKHIDHDILKRFESVGGVRIEDALVITVDGYKNLTTVKSDTAWVEAVCSGEI